MYMGGLKIWFTFQVPQMPRWSDGQPLALGEPLSVRIPAVIPLYWEDHIIGIRAQEIKEASARSLTRNRKIVLPPLACSDGLLLWMEQQINDNWKDKKESIFCQDCTIFKICCTEKESIKAAFFTHSKPRIPKQKYDVRNLIFGN